MYVPFNSVIKDRYLCKYQKNPQLYSGIEFGVSYRSYERKLPDIGEVAKDLLRWLMLWV